MSYTAQPNWQQCPLKCSMDHLPLNDIPMLVSTINFLLRDEIFENLDQICYCFNVEREEMDRLLASQGYAYKEQYNCVK